MPSFFSVAVPALALAGSALANPLVARGGDACLAAVTGKAALGDDNIRRDHCSSFIKTIVTPEAKTVTVTITGEPAAATGWENYKRDVTVCPNEVPNYASACDEAHYKSACKVWGVSGETTFTIPATTTTKTVYVSKGGDCTGATETKTVTEAKETKTVTEAKETVTVTSTPTGGFPAPSGKCLDETKATYFAESFADLLRYTNYKPANGSRIPAGTGYHQNTSDAILDPAFVDYSDSINWMAHFPLGGVTFANKTAFDYGQGVLQPELQVSTLNVWYSCKTFTWRWVATPPTQVKVQGINQFVLNDDLTKITANYAEFNNGVWIDSFTGTCKTP